MMKHFIYKLGHCPDLGIAEFKSLTGDQGCQFNFQWLLSSSELDVNKSGSLVFGAEVLETFEESEKDNFLAYLDKYLSGIENKKLGLFLHGQDPKQVFKIAKKHVNKVTIVDKLPNFGYWKQTNNWLILLKFQSTWFFCKINSYADQEFWSNMDKQLPFADMSRGIINLKLGRSLLNLSSSKAIWDNFAGQGRVLVSGFDLKKSFWASDKDIVVIPQLNKNLEFGSQFWQKSKYNKKIETELSITQKVFQHEAGSRLEFDFEESIAVVTEGYLGKNYREVDMPKALEESQKVSDLWIKVLENLGQKKVTEIVGCLPFYPGLDFEPNYDFLTQNTNWELQKLSKEYFVKYKRENSKVGHLIFKLSRV
jgi:hypothetical protein